MKVVIARHCETDWNKSGRIQGQTDIPLNDTGHAQAELLAKDVVQHGITKLISSDLMRARQTVGYVMRLLKLPATHDARLRENNFGTLEGLSHAEFWIKCGVKHKFGTDALNADFTEFGGERGSDVLARQLAVLDELKTLHADETVMIVGHGRSLRILLTHLGYPTKFLRTQGTHIIIDY